MEPTEYMIKLITTLFEPFEWLVKEHGIINVSWHVFVNSLSLRDVNLDYEDEEVMNMIVAQSLNKIKNISDEEFGLNIQENQEIFFTEPDQLFIKSCQITISMIIFSYLEYHDQCFFYEPSVYCESLEDLSDSICFQFTRYAKFRINNIERCLVITRMNTMNNEEINIPNILESFNEFHKVDAALSLLSSEYTLHYFPINETWWTNFMECSLIIDNFNYIDFTKYDYNKDHHITNQLILFIKQAAIKSYLIFSSILISEMEEVDVIRMNHETLSAGISFEWVHMEPGRKLNFFYMGWKSTASERLKAQRIIHNAFRKKILKKIMLSVGLVHERKIGTVRSPSYKILKHYIYSNKSLIF